MRREVEPVSTSPRHTEHPIEGPLADVTGSPLHVRRVFTQKQIAGFHPQMTEWPSI